MHARSMLELAQECTRMHHVLQRNTETCMKMCVRDVNENIETKEFYVMTAHQSIDNYSGISDRKGMGTNTRPPPPPLPAHTRTHTQSHARARVYIYT